MAATPKISELWLIPAREAMMARFPLPIRGFHSENGSEYINHDVSRLLGKLLIEHTKSRSRPDAQHADAISAFYRGDFHPYVNFYRSCPNRVCWATAGTRAAGGPARP